MMPRHVAPPAQRHHGKRAVGPVVVQVVMLGGHAATVGTAVETRNRPQPPQQPCGLPHHHLPRVALAVAPVVLPRLLAHLIGMRPPPLARRLAHPLRLLRAGAPSGVRPPAACPVLLGIAPVVLACPRAGTHLARRLALAPLVVQVELHQVLLLAAHRARLLQRVVRIAGPILRTGLRNPQPLPHLPSAPSRPRPLALLAHRFTPIVGSSLARSPHTIPLLNGAGCSHAEHPPEHLRHPHATCA